MLNVGYGIKSCNRTRQLLIGTPLFECSWLEIRRRVILAWSGGREQAHDGPCILRKDTPAMLLHDYGWSCESLYNYNFHVFGQEVLNICQKAIKCSSKEWKYGGGMQNQSYMSLFLFGSTIYMPTCISLVLHGALRSMKGVTMLVLGCHPTSANRLLQQSLSFPTYVADHPLRYPHI